MAKRAKAKTNTGRVSAVKCLESEKFVPNLYGVWCGVCGVCGVGLLESWEGWSFTINKSI